MCLRALAWSPFSVLNLCSIAAAISVFLSLFSLHWLARFVVGQSFEACDMPVPGNWELSLQKGEDKGSPHLCIFTDSERT